jgi:hypothetical protein
MCGRFDQHTLPYRYAGYVDAMVRTAQDEPPPRYNVAPQTRAWVARTTRDGQRVLTPLLWGLVSYWDEDAKKAVKPINARSESATTRPMFRKLMEIHRCVVPVDGFYEWRTTPAGKLPYYIPPRRRCAHAACGSVGPLAARRRRAHRVVHYSDDPGECIDRDAPGRSLAVAPAPRARLRGGLRRAIIDPKRRGIGPLEF